MRGWAQQPDANPDPVAGRPPTSSPLYAWNVDDLTTHAFDLHIPGVKDGAVEHRRWVFNTDGTYAEDATPLGGSTAVHSTGTWKINGTDLELSDANGALLDYWRLLNWSEKRGWANIGMEPVPHAGRTESALQVAMRPGCAPVVADAFEPADDGGSLPLKEVAATPFTPEEAHFEMISDHIYMTCKIEGQTVHMLVDTGAYQSSISPKVASALVDAHRNTDLHLQGFGPKSPEVKKWTRKVKLELPGVAFRASLMILPLDFGGEVHPLDGALGMDFMAQLRVRIDYLHQTITFSPPNAGTVPNERGIVLLSKRSVHVPVTMVSGSAPPLTGSMYVDTGASGTMVIEHHPGLPLQGLADDAIVGIGGEDKVHTVRLTSFTFAGMTIRAPEADVLTAKGDKYDAKVLGGIGGELLRRFSVTLDLQHRHVYFDPYTAAMDDPNALPNLPAAPPLSDEMKSLLAKAQAGDAAAERKLGMAYMKGLGIGINMTEGAALLQKASDQGDAEAMERLAMAYAFGAGVPKDEAKALAIAQKAAATGAAAGQLALGDCYDGGFGVKKDLVMARQWYEKAAAQKNTKALSALQSAYWFGAGGPVDLKKAFAYGQQAADLGDAQAEYNLAIMYHDGEGTAKDFAQARIWYGKAADQDFPDAAHNLGKMDVDGEGLKAPDKVAGALSFEKGTELGDAPSLHDLALLMEDSDAVKKYFVDVVPRLQAKAAGGDARAALVLAQLYAMGLGVTQDNHTAVLWAREAAKLGSSTGEAELGLVYARGLGVPQDDATAVAWYQKAADHDDDDARVELGECYEFGIGVTADLAKAKDLYQQAADNGSDEAKTMLARLGAKPAMDLVDAPQAGPNHGGNPFTKMAPMPAVGSPAINSGLVPWVAADLAGAQFDLVDDSGWLQQRGLKLHAVFRADGTMTEEDIDHTGAVPVENKYHWKINGTDLVITDDAGKQVNLWRHVGRYANGQWLIGLFTKEEGGAARVQRKFELTKAASAAPVMTPVAPLAAPSAPSQPPATVPANGVD